MKLRLKRIKITVRYLYDQARDYLLLQRCKIYKNPFNDLLLRSPYCAFDQIKYKSSHKV